MQIERLVTLSHIRHKTQRVLTEEGYIPTKNHWLKIELINYCLDDIGNIQEEPIHVDLQDIDQEFLDKMAKLNDENEPFELRLIISIEEKNNE